MHKKVFLTVLSTDDYLKGVLTLNKSLKKAKAKYPLAVLLAPNISGQTENVLSLSGIETIKMPTAIGVDLNNHNNGPYSHWNHTFDKLYIFALTQFDKIVYLDSDMLVLENVDELFEKEHLSAVSAGSKYPGNEDWEGNLNSGLLVIKPDRKIYEKLITLIPVVASRLKNFGDQDIIHEYCKGNWAENLWLDHKYNMFSIFADWHIKNMNYKLKIPIYLSIYLSIYPLNKKENIKIIHYIGFPKPWMKKASRFAVLKMNLKTFAYALVGKIDYGRVAASLYYKYSKEFNSIQF